MSAAGWGQDPVHPESTKPRRGMGEVDYHLNSLCR